MVRTTLLAVLIAMLSAAERPDPLDVASVTPSATGLLVTRVFEGGEAARVGLSRGDIVTSYAGTLVRSIEELAAAVAAVQGAEAKVGYVHDGRPVEITVKAGKLGVGGRKAEAGVAIVLVPPSTGAKPDFAALAKGPQEHWYAFTIGGKKVGLEWQRVSRAGDQVSFASEVCFDGEPQWSLQQFVEENTLAIGPHLAPLRLRHAFPLGDWVATAQAVDRDGRRLWSLVVIDEGKEKAAESSELPAGALPDYVAGQLPAFLPRQAGACLHYRMLMAHSAATHGLHAIVAGDEEEIAVGAVRLRARRYEQRSAGGAGRVTWVADDVIVRQDYGNDTVAYLTTRDEALRGLDQRFKLQLAK